MMPTRTASKTYYFSIACRIVGLLIAVVTPLSVGAAGASTAADNVLQTAIKLRLYDDPTWLALGHYRRDGKGWMSTVDDPRFFLADRGKTDPKAELEATIRAFHATGTNIEEHATSRFVARLAWLRERCSLSAGEIPTFKNTAYDRLLAEAQPTRIILAFPAPSADAISSAFGHVFLIFVHTPRSPLLAPTVNYAALIDEHAGILYPIFGLTGGFKAYFTTLSYAERLKEYNSIACRDMWEYELALTPTEVERIFQHTWEMRRIYSRYFFLDENCSYGVLALLDVVRPGLCSPAFDRRLFILPLDVIRQLRTQGLVKCTRYVPSVLTSMRTAAQLLSSREITATKAMAYGEETPKNGLLKTTNSVTQVTMLDVAMSLAQIRAAAGKTPAGEQQRIMGALIHAAPSVRVGQPAGALSVAPPCPPCPETAHLPSRLSTGTVKCNDTFYWFAAFRPAYHDFLDPSEAMEPAVQIQILATEALVDKTGNIAKWQLCLFDMETFKPCDALHAPLSRKFKVSTNYRNDFLSSNEWNFAIEGGSGYSFALFPRSLMYGLGEVELQTRTIHGETWLGVGPAVGFVTDLPWRARGFVEGTFQMNALDPDRLRLNLSAGWSVSITKQTSLVVQYAQERISGYETRTELGLEARVYF